MALAFSEEEIWLSAETSPITQDISPRRLLVVGGGISGLATAWLSRRQFGRNLNIRLVEASEQVGGTTQSVSFDGHVLEKGPNGFLAQRHSLCQFIDDVGLGSQVIRASADAKRRFIFLGDRLRPAPSGPLSLLTTHLLSLKGKFQLFAEPFRPPAPQEDESIAHFGNRRLGEEATNIFLDAAVTGTWAGDYSKLSLNACFPTLAEWEREHGSLFHGIRRSGQPRPKDKSVLAPRFGLLSLRGGMGTLTQELARQLGTLVQTGTPVQSLSREPESWLVHTNRDTHRADAVVLACPAYQQVEILNALDPSLASVVREIPYAPLVVCTLTYPREVFADRFRGFGYIAPERLRRPVLGVVFSSEVFPDPSDSHRVHLRALLGGWHQQQVIDWDDRQIVKTVSEDLALALGIDRKPDSHWICRWDKGIPQYWVGHQERLRSIESGLQKWPGLILGGNAYRGVALHDCVTDAQRSVDRLQALFFAT